jgi:hypothetical protein
MRSCLQERKPLKAPGLDGFQPIFYQIQGNIAGSEECKFIREAFDDENDILEVINHSCLVLIPKSPRP